MKKLISKIIVGCVALGTLSISLAALTLGWFAGAGGQTDNQAVDGEIGLRGYFYDGDGKVTTPYEIVSPIHFYNLVRLQNLGIFPEKTYFQIGHDFGGNTGLKCINPSSENEYDDYLDMSYLDGTIILPIGGEGTPFVGNFNGNGIPVKNLKVSGYPEDIGVFGYISPEGVVDGLVCDNLEVTSLGYTNDTTANDYELFSANITDILSSVHRFAANTNLDFYKYTGSTYTTVKANGLRSKNGVGVSIQNIDSSNNLIAGTKYFNGYFLPTYPSVEGDPFTYSWQTSSPLIKEVTMQDVNGGSEEQKVMVLDLNQISAIPTDPGPKDFNNGGDMQVNARLYLKASVTIDGYTFSRVIQSYTVEFNSNGHIYGDGYFSANIYCDYVDQNDPTDHNTNYHHGCNIGLLAGHVDGTIKNSYVFNGTLKFNETGFTPINTESQTGLVGEVGINVANSFDDDLGVVTNGNIGIINFSKIYSKIRDDMKTGVTVKAGYIGSTSFISYSKYLKDGTGVDANGIDHGDEDSFSSFSNFLRKSAGNNYEYITKTSTSMNTQYDADWHDYTPTTIKNDFNSVDFLWNQLIEDENGKYARASGSFNPDTKYYTKTTENGVDKYTIVLSPVEEDFGQYYVDVSIDRGMGVFKVVTSKNDAAAASVGTAEYGNYYLSNIGDCSIQNGNPKTKVYFSTAEYVHYKQNEQKQWVSLGNQPSWGGKLPFRATELPSYSDTLSFEYPFSRDYDYVFELDLSQMEIAGKNQYMWNTDSTFLTNYLSTKLIDKYGAPITPHSSKFGFMFMSSEGERLTQLSSYMPVGEPGDKVRFGSGTNADPYRYYPSKSIVFSIDNATGANVSIVGNGGNISIYGFDHTTSSNTVTKLLTMKSSNHNTAPTEGANNDRDYHRYFTYDVSSGNTSTETVVYGSGEGEKSNMLDNNCLYGHIFKLPPGDYAVGAQSGANVYFLAVQGQTDASIGSKDIAEVGDALVDVDFLTVAPTYGAFAGDSLEKALFHFESVFNSTSGAFYVEVKTVNDIKYISIRFSDSPNRFVTYLKLQSHSVQHAYYVNDSMFNYAEYVYRTS